MHPNGAFGWNDALALRAFVAQHAFAHLFVATAEGPMVAHLPLVAVADGFQFHLARSNRIAGYLDGAPVIASVGGAHGYVSPDWYAGKGQVPTWNYEAVEIEGAVHALDATALTAHLDLLSAAHETRLLPKPMWTTDKVDGARLQAMLGAIVGFELTVTDIRGTRKFSQNKSPEDRAGVRDALTALGRDDVAAMIPQ